MALAALLVGGCTPSLPGLSDRALVISSHLAPATLAPLVQQRLAAARLSANVRTDGANLLVVVAGAQAPTARKVLAYDRHVTVQGRSELVASVERRGRELHIVTHATGVDGPTGPLAFGPYAVNAGERRGDTLIAQCTGSLSGYAECAKLARWLNAKSLPPFQIIEDRPAPAAPLRALACVLVPIALSLAWLSFVQRFDRAHPEPLRLVALVFAAGAVGAIGAGAVEVLLARVIPNGDPGLFTFGGDIRALPLSTLAFSVLVGVPEESAKWLAARLAYKRAAFDEPIDGIVYAAAASVGFAAAENIVYFGSARMSPAVIAARALLTLPAHVLFASVWGFAAGQDLVHPKRFRVLKAIALSALLHGAYDACLSTEGAASVALLVAMCLAVLFMTFLRRALRFGIIEAGSVPDIPTRLTPTGSALLFAGSASGFCLSAALLFGLGAFASVGIFTPSGTFITLLSATFAALLLSGWGITRTLPLDVALSAKDVVFAGARWPLGSVTSVQVHRAGARSWVHLQGHRGVLTVGPLDAEAAAALGASIEDARIVALLPPG
jgi:RsiW-degrading membrane proteinase PrsW (M82 family)